MGTRHFYWILTGPSFAVHTPSQKKYRKKYKQRSPNYKLNTFRLENLCFTYHSPLTRLENIQRIHITLNMLVLLLPILIQIRCLHIQNKYTQSLDFYVYLIRKTFYIHKLLKLLK